MKYRRLAAEIKINKLTLKNRIVMPAIHHAYTNDGSVTPRFRDYYFRRAEGGAGLIIVGSCRIDDFGAKRNSVSLADDDNLHQWREFTNGMHEREAAVAAQLYHAGRYMKKRDVPNGSNALSPSAVYSPYTREAAPEMSVRQIAEVIKSFADAALRTKAAGFDAVEISGSSGYLLCQFLSPLTNLRTDMYGGSFQNRCRLPLEVIKAVREAVGDDFPVLYRLSADDLVQGSNRLADILQFVPMAEAAGIDCFDVTGGWHESTVPQLTGDAPRAVFSHFARSVKCAVKVPVIQCNRMSTPHDGELALALGDADLVGYGRAQIAEPDFARLALSGREDEIRPCVACNQGCLASAFFDKPVQCLVNALCGRESDIQALPAKTERILIIGGGPAGCEAAIRASQLGHEVTLAEKGEAPGGKLRLLSRIPGKAEFARLIDYYSAMIIKQGIRLLLNTEITAEGAQGYDRVLLATGGTKSTVEPSGIPVYTAEQILEEGALAGSRVVVASGGFRGLQTALFLAREASLDAEKLYFMTVNELLLPNEISALTGSSKRSITILESAEKAGNGFEPGTAWPVLRELNRLGVRIKTHAELIRADSGGAYVKANGKEEFIPCDCIVTANPPMPDSGLLESLRANGCNAAAIGDARTAGKCFGAIHSAVNCILNNRV